MNHSLFMLGAVCAVIASCCNFWIYGLTSDKVNLYLGLASAGYLIGAIIVR